MAASNDNLPFSSIFEMALEVKEANTEHLMT
jgi:hypothetical protein